MNEETNRKFKLVEEKLIEMQGVSEQMTAKLEGENQTLIGGLQERFAEFDKLETKLKEEFQKCYTEMSSTKAHLDDVERRISSSGVTGGAFTQSSAGWDGKKIKLTGKDCPVAKMTEKMDVLEFRQWLATVERQLEGVHGFKGIDAVMEKLRFAKLKIDKDNHTDMFKNLAIEDPGTFANATCWEFDDTGRFL